MTLAVALALSSAILWQDPGRVEAIDFSSVETEPKAPYTFLREDLKGTSPKIYVRDANGVEWRVKGGRDAMPEAFITRFVSALGYYAETTKFSARGHIRGVPPLKRASGFVKADGSYTWASFEKAEKGARFIGTWSWIDPALRNKRELKGLKILVMLFSNWDNKDKRDSYKGSNTSILQLADGRVVYFVNDWGQSLGSWGRLFGRMNWDCDLFTKQTPEFVRGVDDDGNVRFGYSGGHTLRFRDDIRVEDVKWLMQYLGRITDAQLRMGLKASGASPDQEECFTRALRARIEQLRKITVQ